MNTITAAEARAIAEVNLAGPAIESFVDSLSAQIRYMAEKGRTSFDPWLHIGSLRCVMPSQAERDAIQTHFMQAGFLWEDFPNPDPGHPASRSYTVLSWK